MGLTTSVLAILEEGFRRTWILILDDNMEKTTILTEWIREHEGADFEYHLEESETSALPSKEEEEELPFLIHPFSRQYSILSSLL